MTRGQFLKSILVALVAPKVLTELEVPVVIADPSAKAMWFKVSNEMLADPLYMRLLSDPIASPLAKRAKRYGIDLDKPYDFQIGFIDDDFIYNLKTIIITQ